MAVFGTLGTCCSYLPILYRAENKKNICEKVFLINSFYKNHLGKIPKIGVLGLNPHCESINKFNEDEKIIKPSIKYLKNLKFGV